MGVSSVGGSYVENRDVEDSRKMQTTASVIAKNVPDAIVAVTRGNREKIPLS
jgi:hypothetical protein